jgi:predicted MFS family arabinose efflux permease
MQTTAASVLRARLGGLLLDHFSIAAAFLGGAALLVLAAAVAGRGMRLQPRTA